MLKKIRNILSSSAKEYGWVMEPDAKDILQLAGVDVPAGCWAKTADDALIFAQKQGFPLAMKVISPQVLHKSDVGGVIIGIDDEEEVLAAFDKMSRIDGFIGVFIEEMCRGIELIVGAKIDFQFGPVVMLGIGGVSVEIYRDTVIRMAPTARNDIESMVRNLKAHALLEGFRGAEPVNMEELNRLMIAFSKLVIDISDEVESIDLNPVICDGKRCLAADARIILP